MIRTRRIYKALKVLGLGILAICISPLAQAATQSTNIAYIQTQTVANGGAFPFSSSSDFNPFHFYQLPYNQVTPSILAPGGVCGTSACDTVLLNVASSFVLGAGSFNCSTGLLSADAKAALLSFVNNGGKLIIYDSECNTQDYSWLPYPFTTHNPGATGAFSGTVHVVEDNDLSSNNSADSHYINAPLMPLGTDAVADMNVMTTRDPNWCLDMSGTNVAGVTGPTHAYARYGNGLIIYNGFDVDYMGTSTVPTSLNARGNLAKIWLQELQAPFNPTPLAAMPCGVSVVGITLTPPTATNNLSLSQLTHTVTASLKDLTGTPEPNILVSFSVVSGPNAGASGTCSTDISCHTDSNGEVSFTYTSNGTVGTDTIRACYTDSTGAQQCSQDVTKEWVTGGSGLKCDLNGDGVIDRTDIAHILSLLHTTVPPSDPVADLDNDGIITINDARGCVLRCTNPRCTP